MPIGKHYEGHGEEVMRSMKKQYGAKKGKEVFYATENKFKSHMPKGATMSPKGDLGQHRADEVRGAFPRPIKAAGRGNLTGLPYRRPETATDTKLSLPKDEVT